MGLEGMGSVGAKDTGVGTILVTCSGHCRSPSIKQCEMKSESMASA